MAAPAHRVAVEQLNLVTGAVIGQWPSGRAASRHLQLSENFDKEDGDVRRNITEAPRKTPRATGERGFPKALRWHSDERSRLLAEYAGRFEAYGKASANGIPTINGGVQTGMIFLVVYL